MNPFSRQLSPFFRTLFPAAFVLAFTLTLGGLGLAEARPAWSLEPSLGGGRIFSDRKPERFRGSRLADFPVFALSIAGEMAIRNPWSVGIRAWVNADVTSPPGVDPDFDRMVGAIVPYAKRTLYERGGFDLTGVLGLGYENMDLNYTYGSVDTMFRHPDPPPREDYHSPVLALGLSQRAFAGFIGFTVNETLLVSFHTVSYHLDFGIPIGWRKRR